MVLIIMGFKVVHEKKPGDKVLIVLCGRMLVYNDETVTVPSVLLDFFREISDEIIFRNDGDAVIREAEERFEDIRISDGLEEAKKYRGDILIAKLLKHLWETARNDLFRHFDGAWKWIDDEFDGISIGFHYDVDGWTGLVVVKIRNFEYDEPDIDPASYHLFFVEPDAIKLELLGL